MMVNLIYTKSLKFMKNSNFGESCVLPLVGIYWDSGNHMISAQIAHTFIRCGFMFTSREVIKLFDYSETTSVIFMKDKYPWRIIPLLPFTLCNENIHASLNSHYATVQLIIALKALESDNNSLFWPLWNGSLFPKFLNMH